MLERMRQSLDPEQFESLGALFERRLREARAVSRRRGEEGSMPAPVEPPRGPKPLAGGAAAPLEFD